MISKNSLSSTIYKRVRQSPQDDMFISLHRQTQNQLLVSEILTFQNLQKNKKNGEKIFLSSSLKETSSSAFIIKIAT